MDYNDFITYTRYLHKLKGYICNKANPEGSIAEVT